MIKVGCCGFPVNRETYFRRFPCVEINSAFYSLPQAATAENWRRQAPADFDYSLKAWQLITHPSSSPTYEKLSPRQKPKRLERCGHFQGSDEVTTAWLKVAELAEILKARFILFQTPASFYPNADHLRDIYRFFKGIRRPKAALAWEPRGVWEPRIVAKVCEDLGLIHVVDPLHGDSQREPVRYWRLHGRLERGRIHYQHDFSDEELKKLLAKGDGRLTYAFFNNSSMWKDAQRFLDMIQPRIIPGRRPSLF